MKSPVMYYKRYSAVVTRYYPPSEGHYGMQEKKPFWFRWIDSIAKWFKRPTKRNIKIR